MIRWLMAGLATAAALAGQTLHVPASHVTRKTPGAFSIDLEAPPGKAPATIQWEMSFPPALQVDAQDIVVGGAAGSAGKSITCAKSAAKTEVKDGTRYVCILTGGEKPIGNGPIAIVHFHLQTDVEGAPIRVPIEHARAVSADLKRLDIPDAAAIITTQ